MSDRETKFITTPVKNHKVEIKTYITGREQQAVETLAQEKIVAKARNLTKNGNPDIDIPIGNLTIVKTNEYIKTIVVSIDDSAENILDRVLDMNLTDYNCIADELNKIVSGSYLEEKKSQI